MEGVSIELAVAVPLGWSRRTGRVRAYDAYFRRIVSRFQTSPFYAVTVTRNYQKNIVELGDAILTDTSPLLTEDCHLVAVSNVVSHFGGIVFAGLNNPTLAEVFVNTYRNAVPLDGVREYVRRYAPTEPFVTLSSKQPRRLVLYTGEKGCTLEYSSDVSGVTITSSVEYLDELEPVEILFGTSSRWNAPPRSIVFLDVTEYTPVVTVEELNFSLESSSTVHYNKPIEH